VNVSSSVSAPFFLFLFLFLEARFGSVRFVSVRFVVIDGLELEVVIYPRGRMIRLVFLCTKRRKDIGSLGICS